MKQLKVFSSSEIYPFEISCLKACSSLWSKSLGLQQTIYPSKYFKIESKKLSSDDLVWFWSKDWKKSVAELASLSLKQRGFISVLSTEERSSSLLSNVFDSLTQSIPPHITLIVHGPVPYRFFVEMVGLPESQVKYLPLPMPVASQKEASQVFSFGSFCPLIEESNLHFILTVAHYLKKKTEKFQLCFSEAGFLRAHLEKLASDLRLEERVRFLKDEEMEKLDVLLYFPEKNDHFVSVLSAASRGILPICKRLPDIDNYVVDTQTGFVFEGDDTRAVGELLFSLSNNPSLRKEMGARFHHWVAHQHPPEQVLENYATLLENL